jgi:hypothetical protein
LLAGGYSEFSIVDAELGGGPDPGNAGLFNVALADASVRGYELASFFCWRESRMAVFFAADY